MDNPLSRDTLETLMHVSKISSLIGFIANKKRKTIVKNQIIKKRFAIFELDLRPEEIAIIHEKQYLLKKVLEKFLYSFNYETHCNYLNISFCPVEIAGYRQMPSCIVLFYGRTPAGLKSPGYKTLHTLYLKVNSGQEAEKEKPGDSKQDIFDQITQMFTQKNLSVRNLFALGMKQWQSRMIYKKIQQLGIFELIPENPNEKIYHPENFSALTKEIVEHILSLETSEE